MVRFRFPILFVATAAIVGCTASTSNPAAQGQAAATGPEASDDAISMHILWEGGSARDPEGAAADAIAQGNTCFALAQAGLADAVRDPDVRKLAQDVIDKAQVTHLDLIYWVDIKSDVGWIKTTRTVEPDLTVDLWKDDHLQIDQKHTVMGTAPYSDWAHVDDSMSALLESGACEVTKEQVLDLLSTF